MTLPDFTEEQQRFIQTAKDIGLWGQICSDAGIVRFAEALTQWQPIETAPKDGTRIDVWNGFERISNVYWGECDLDCNSYYLPKGIYDFCVHDPDLILGCGRSQQVAAKFWMPLPVSPK